MVQAGAVRGCDVPCGILPVGQLFRGQDGSGVIMSGYAQGVLRKPVFQNTSFMAHQIWREPGEDGVLHSKKRYGG